jgi:hypothetical protein
MARLALETHVRFKTADRKTHFGRVTHQRGRTYRVVDYDGARFGTDERTPARRVVAKSMTEAKSGVFVFDTQLDSAWSTSATRAGAGFWREVCNAAGWSFAYERVHSLQDLLYFLKERTIPQRVLVFNGHGDKMDGFGLTNGDTLGCRVTPNGETCVASCSAGSKRRCMHNPDGNQRCPEFRRLRLKPENAGKVIVFSSCLMGKNRKLCLELKKMLRAEAVVAYSDEIKDNLCFFAEPQLVSLVLDRDCSPGDAVAKVRDNMQPWKPVVAKWKKRYPLECY